MNSNKYFICCEKCFETIGRTNTRAARIWMDFCAMYLENGLFGLDFDFGEIGVLERLGFLVSYENPDSSLAIRVKGHMNSVTGEHFFCVKEGCHDQDM